jgi:Na+-transporting NADH:ubiquinone oxidoreductase subunit B
MKSIRKIVDNIKPHFEKGGKYEKFSRTFEAFETFLFVPNKTTSQGAHIRDAIDMKRTMSLVVISMIPALLFGMWNVGHQHFLATGQEGTLLQAFWEGFKLVLPIVIVSYATGLAIEFLFAEIRGHEVNEGFLVSGMLIPLVLPVDVPLWMVATATAFAVIFGKEVFGGTGMNILNPALTARAFLFFAYPAYMSGNQVWIHGLMKGEGIVDGFSGATPLGLAAEGNVENIPSASDMFFGFIPGSIGETSALAVLIGAVILLYTSRQLENYAFYFSGRSGNGFDFKCLCCESFYGNSGMGTSDNGRICLRCRIYGD